MHLRHHLVKSLGIAAAMVVAFLLFPSPADACLVCDAMNDCDNVNYSGSCHCQEDYRLFGRGAVVKKCTTTGNCSVQTGCDGGTGDGGGSDPPAVFQGLSATPIPELANALPGIDAKDVLFGRLLWALDMDDSDYQPMSAEGGFHTTLEDGSVIDSFRFVADAQATQNGVHAQATLTEVATGDKLYVDAWIWDAGATGEAILEGHAGGKKISRRVEWGGEK